MVPCNYRAWVVVAALSTVASPGWAAKLKTIHSFTSNDAPHQKTAFLLYQNVLYGASETGGGAYGSIFSVDPKTGQVTTVYGFDGGADGAYPRTSLIEVNGVLWGTTAGGGSENAGTIFSFDPATEKESAAYAFLTPSEENSPSGELLYNKGTLYGVAGDRNTSNNGSVFSFDIKKATLKTLHNFTSSTDGSALASGLSELNGVLYGTTQFGGSANGGIIYAVDAGSGSENVLTSFPANQGQYGPYIGLTYVDGIFYGTTVAEGSASSGTLFKYDPASNTYTLLYTFGAGQDAAMPSGRLVYQNGVLYGTSFYGGAAGDGTIFSYNPSTNVETVLYSFKGGKDGAIPIAGLTYCKSAFYGTTYSAGASNNGTIFRFSP
jgi:uncharacterized repeat protein (TIGR03803 family)